MRRVAAGVRAQGRRRGRRRAPCVAVLLGALLPACATSVTPAPPGRGDDGSAVDVVAGENAWGDIARQVGGSHARVTSILREPGADPHLHEAAAQDAGAVARARIVIVNGAGYDAFLPKLLAATPNGARQVVTVATVLGVAGHDPNPHLWYDVARVPVVAAAIEAALARADARDAAAFETNLARFDSSLQPILDTIERIRQRHSGTAVAYTERVPEYLVAGAGLEVKTPPGFARAVENGDEPGPADTQAMTSVLSSGAVRALLYNPQAASPVTARVRDLARAGGVPVVDVTETLPPAQRDFQSWQLGQAKALLAALGG